MAEMGINDKDYAAHKPKFVSTGSRLYFVKKDFVISHFRIKYLNKDNQERYLEFKYLDILKL